MVERNAKATTLKNYGDICVVQRNLKSGCIPTGIEWILRYLKIPGVNFEGFQERHNLYLLSEGKEGNSFCNVSRHVENEVPGIKFSDRPFPSGQEKIDFIQKLIEKSVPCLISLVDPQTGSCHTVPVVEIDGENIIVLWMNKGTVEGQKKSIKLDAIKQIHDENLKSSKGLDILFVNEQEEEKRGTG